MYVCLLTLFVLLLTLFVYLLVCFFTCMLKGNPEIFSEMQYRLYCLKKPFLNQLIFTYINSSLHFASFGTFSSQ